MDFRMEFRILGPLEVRDRRGHLVVIGQPVHREVLAVLLFYAGERCSQDRLIEALWPDGRPKRPVANLAVHICRIRAQLGQAAGLKTLPGAYQIDPDPGALDLREFQLLTARAQQAIARDDRQLACELLRAALQCWREPPLNDLPSAPCLAGDVAQLLQQRRTAESTHIDLMLALRRHQEVVADLHGMVMTADYRLDEHVWWQLILALHRCGRRADALYAYQRARDVLKDDLGLEPSDDLQRLLNVVLHDGEDRAVPAALGGPAGRERVLAAGR